MSAHTLRFESPEKILELRAPSNPHSASIGLWRVSENYQPNTHRDLQEGLGSYRLILERPVSAQEEVWLGLREAEQIAKEVDVAWCYACGTPFFAVPQTMVLVEAPIGWTGNARRVEVEIQKERGLGYAEALQVFWPQWLSFPFLPLERVLVVRDALLKASPEIQCLVDLHIAAHKTHHGELFFYAKALELAGAFFGQGRSARNSGLQKQVVKIGVAPHLTQTVEWLFEMANTRFDVRHVVNGYSPVTLHPTMSGSERAEFQFNADLVIRGFICDQLGVDIIVWRDPPRGTCGGVAPKS